MARGNDAQAARKELEEELGVGTNAEQLIAANAARFPAELRAALIKRPDEEATADLDPAKVQAAVDDDVVDYAVHGDHVVIVTVGSDGRSGKVALPVEDVGGKADEESKPAKKAPAPRRRKKS